MDAVAPTAMTAAPANWMNGIAESAPMATHDHTGVCSLGFTLASGLENGSWLSRAMPKPRRMVDVRMDMQHTKMAAETTSRYSVDRPFDRTLSMMAGGLANPATASFRFGTAIRTPHRKMAPMMNAPITEASTALGASRRGSRVSSASVDAVSNP